MNRMHIGRRLVAVTALLAAACSKETPTVPTSAASIAGRVTLLDRDGERIGTVRVEADPAATSGSDKAVVRITQRTIVVGPDGKSADYNALAQGQWVRVWFTGPVAESYPVQAAAAAVVIDSAAR